MGQYHYTIRPFSTNRLLIQVAAPPSVELLAWLLAKTKKIKAAVAAEVRHTYNELLISTAGSLQKDRIDFHKILDQDEILHLPEATTHHIPVCYTPRWAPDLTEFAKHKKLSVSDIIQLHTKPDYLVYFLGFLPGFPYLDGLDERLTLPRKRAPSQKIPAGSVAIGGSQTGIYPQESPGGWHVIGRTPLTIFDPKAAAPSFFSAGDRITFYAITGDEYTDILKRDD